MFLTNLCEYIFLSFLKQGEGSERTGNDIEVCSELVIHKNRMVWGGSYLEGRKLSVQKSYRKDFFNP